MQAIDFEDRRVATAYSVAQSGRRYEQSKVLQKRIEQQKEQAAGAVPQVAASQVRPLHVEPSDTLQAALEASLESAGILPSPRQENDEHSPAAGMSPSSGSQTKCDPSPKAQSLSFYSSHHENAPATDQRFAKLQSFRTPKSSILGGIMAASAQAGGHSFMDARPKGHTRRRRRGHSHTSISKQVILQALRQPTQNNSLSSALSVALDMQARIGASPPYSPTAPRARSTCTASRREQRSPSTTFTCQKLKRLDTDMTYFESSGGSEQPLRRPKARKSPIIQLGGCLSLGTAVTRLSPANKPKLMRSPSKRARQRIKQVHHSSVRPMGAQMCFLSLPAGSPASTPGAWSPAMADDEIQI